MIVPPRDYQLHIRVLRTTDAKEIISQIELKVDPEVSLTHSHKGSYVQDPQGGLIVQF
jgi:hypothetical protein